MIMNFIKGMVGTTLALSVGCFCLAPITQTVAAESSVQPVIQTGLALWAKNGASMALDTWQKGGLMEGDGKTRVLNNYFRQLDRTLGNYESCELLDTKGIGQSSRVVYLSMNFQRGAVYARFVLYRTEKEWVVQNMDFSTRPEAIMPGMVFEGVKYAE
jgi:hypothetical protein